jgi:hypothetical protein
VAVFIQKLYCNDARSAFASTAHYNLLQAAAQKSPMCGDTPQRLIDACECRDADLHVVRIDYDMEIVGCFVTETVERKAGSYLNVWAIAGERMDDCIDDVNAYLYMQAQLEGHRGVVLAGRPGWTKTLKHYGFEVDYVGLKRELV